MKEDSKKLNHYSVAFHSMNEQPRLTKKGPDISKMQLVQITSRTAVYFKKGIDIEAAVAKWKEAHSASQY